MSSIETIWYSIIGLCCLFALADWRKAIFVGILLDVLRDPVRKLTPEQPVAITLSVAVVWLLIVLVAGLSNAGQVRALFRNYPKLRAAFQLGVMALIPAAGISILSYNRGWLMAAIGAASYIVPSIGILAGFVAFRREVDLRRLFVFYITANALMLISVPLEYAGLDWPAFGGIDYNWIRYHENTTVELMCGWYRSPDIMGLHAAQVIMFCLLLSMRSRNESAVAWPLLAVWAAFCVFVSGRRKMIGIPLVFVAVYLALGLSIRLTRLNRLAGAVAVLAILAAAASVLIWSPDEASGHIDLAMTLVTQGVTRSNEILSGSVLGTLQQSGIIGAGLGSATQGRYYAGIKTNSRAGWQEDGVSRLLLEFGVPGLLLLIIAIFLVLRCLKKAVISIPRQSELALMQVGLVSIVAGNAASFAISHQQFSGDPVSALVVTLMVGAIFKMPGLVVDQKPAIGGTAVANPELLSVASSSQIRNSKALADSGN